MEKREVIWTEPAKSSLRGVFDFLAEVSELMALRITKKILKKSHTLEDGYVQIGQIEPLLKSRKKDYRYMLEGNYKIIYNEQDGNIVIHLVFDTRQDTKKLKRGLK